MLLVNAETWIGLLRLTRDGKWAIDPSEDIRRCGNDVKSLRKKKKKKYMTMFYLM